MRVAVVHPVYTPFGGGARMIDDIVRLLSQAGAEVTMLVRRWSGEPPPGVEIRRFEPFHIGSTWRDWGFERAVAPALGSGFDLVVSDQKIPGVEVYIAGGGVHREYIAHRMRRAGTLARFALALRPHVRYTATAESRLFGSPRLRAVICVSRRTRDDIVRWYGLPPQRLHVIPNGIDTRRFDAAWRDEHRAESRRQFALDDAFTLAFVGSGFERKGLAPLLRAMARSRLDDSGLDVRLLVAGKDRHMRRFERLAHQLGLGERVRFLGPVVDVRPVYAAADATALLSSFEPFGLGPLEGLSMGLPTLVSREAGVSELITDGVEGWRVDPDDTVAVAGRLRELAQRHRSMRAACIALASRHDSSAMLASMRALFESLDQPLDGDRRRSTGLSA